MKQVIVIGGGIAGLISSILLAKSGVECMLIEKKRYPYHRVCGEYISNEALPFLKSLQLYPESVELPNISRFMLTSVKGKHHVLPLDLGGFGVSRYFFDDFLFKTAHSLGVTFLLETSVESVEFSEHSFLVKTPNTELHADVVLGSYGKRSNLDIKLDRTFIKQRSPYVGIKYHIRYDHPSDLIALHNFPGGYCGISEVEEKKVNLCYLVHREKLKESKTIEQLQETALSVNPFLKDIFENAEFLFQKPETINEISFEPKSAIENHMLMLGDAAGMITPLCGNGMAMAIHSAKIATDYVKLYVGKKITRAELESAYVRAWKNAFSWRLFAGRQIQNLFGSETASNIAINLALYLKPVALQIIKNTHGRPFK